jgi:hypothetical protein
VRVVAGRCVSATPPAAGELRNGAEALA